MTNKEFDDAYFSIKTKVTFKGREVNIKGIDFENRTLDLLVAKGDWIPCRMVELVKPERATITSIHWETNT